MSDKAFSEAAIKSDNLMAVVARTLINSSRYQKMTVEDALKELEQNLVPPVSVSFWDKNFEKYYK